MMKPIFVTDLALKWFPLHKFISSIRSSLRYAALIFSLIIWRRVPTPQKALLCLPWFSLCIFKCVLNLWVPEYLPVPVLFSLAPIVFAHGQDSISLCLVPAPPFRHLSLGRVGSQLFRLFWYLSPGLLVIIIIIIRVNYFQWTSWIFWYLSLGQLHTAQFHSFLSFWHICLSTLLFYPTALHLAGMQSVLSWGEIFRIINISLGNFLAPFYVENWIKIPSSTLSLSFWHICWRTLLLYATAPHLAGMQAGRLMAWSIGSIRFVNMSSTYLLAESGNQEYF